MESTCVHGHLPLFLSPPVEPRLTYKCRFIRDESSKGRYDPAITKVCFEILLELFGRTLKSDLGPFEANLKVEDIC